MGNPWEKIDTGISGEDPFAWLYSDTDKIDIELCPYCKSYNTTEVWIDGDVSTYICNVCNIEFNVNNGGRGAIVDYQISDRAYASVWDAHGVYHVQFNVVDDCVWELEFADKVLADSYISRVVHAYNTLEPGANLISSGSILSIVSVDNDVAELSNGADCLLLRIAVGVVEGNLAIDVRK